MRWFMAVVLGLIGISTMGCQAEDQLASRSGSEQPVQVRTQSVQMVPVPVVITAVGTTEPYIKATPGTRVLGQVEQVRVNEGDEVEQGQVLVRIENRDLSARRRQAESALQEAKVTLGHTQTQMTRVRNLYNEKAVSKQALDDAETALARAQAGMTAAEGALKEVDVNLEYASLRSPIDGVVVGAFVDRGDMANPGVPLFAIEQQDTMKATVAISERDLAYVKVGKVVDVLLEDEVSVSGRIATVIPSADVQSRTFDVQVVLNNEARKIRSGMFVRVGFQKDTRSGLLISQEAVVKRGQLRGVFVVRDDRAYLRWVRLGKRFGDRVEVLSGLSDGDRIVIQNMHQLTDGTMVEVGADG